MPSIAKPSVTHPSLQRNQLGLTIRDYEGSMSTLCAGCGHDSITAAITRALWELATPPHMIAKLSGIGCSSKTPSYFVSGAHGFNSAHGRMATIATGANAANRELVYIGVSGDGDSLSIGLGHLCHAVRRNVRMVYIIENNGVYGLTKGQFSATADVGSTQKGGRVNELMPIDCCELALQLGCGFVARSFSGDQKQLRSLLKAAFSHRGASLLDVMSPCVTFADHEGSTKSYAYVKEHDAPLHTIDFVPYYEDITVDYAPGTTRDVEMPDGSHVVLQKLADDYDPTSREGAFEVLERARREERLVTGLIYIDPDAKPLADELEMGAAPLATLPLERVRPSRDVLEKIMDGLKTGSGA